VTVEFQYVEDGVDDGGAVLLLAWICEEVLFVGAAVWPVVQGGELVLLPGGEITVDEFEAGDVGPLLVGRGVAVVLV
jgi:hypothetical protein